MLALTSKGSVLSTIAFRSEEPTAGRVKKYETLFNEHIYTKDYSSFQRIIHLIYDTGSTTRVKTHKL